MESQNVEGLTFKAGGGDALELELQFFLHSSIENQRQKNQEKRNLHKDDPLNCAGSRVYLLNDDCRWRSRLIRTLCKHGQCHAGKDNGCNHRARKQ